LGDTNDNPTQIIISNQNQKQESRTNKKNFCTVFDWHHYPENTDAHPAPNHRENQGQ
jgi:hypothetical protein